jgi:hypothetical protein
MESWPVALAHEFSPREERVADEIARCYARGGRLRRSLLVTAGERTAGFGGTNSPGELALIFDVLRQCGLALLAVLEHPAVGNATGAAALLIAVAQWRQDRKPDRDREPASESNEVRVTVDMSPEAAELAYRALEDTASRFAARGHDQESAWDRARRLLNTLAREPRSAAGFVRSLDKSLHSVQRGRFMSILWRFRTWLFRTRF